MARRRLRDDTTVVRFGLMRLADLHAAALRSMTIRGHYGLSFFGENGLTVEDLALEACLPHRWLFTSTCGRVRSLGYTLRREGARNHLVLRFLSKPTEAELQALARVFDGPWPNPHPFR
jgi:hypothetical protein